MGKRRFTTKETRIGLYAASQYLNRDVEQELGIRIPFDVYLQDPLVAKNDPKFGFDDDFYVKWELGLNDGPTSARFAIVDYNGDTGHLAPKAKWDSKSDKFLDAEGNVLDRDNSESYQFHQLNVWAILQSTLSFYEEGQGLGRSIPFGFEGNRLIVLPHAGYGQNAYYDRNSKSLQFYYFNTDVKTVFTCLSADIINHEFGHAILDGIRPYLFESTLVETGAFHEFVADNTAILAILRNNEFRKRLADKTDGRLSEAEILASIAQEFGEAVTDNPYLRTATNEYKMSDLLKSHGVHFRSQVLTGAMFDALIKMANFYVTKASDSSKTGFYNAIQQMQRLAIQSLDLLPPMDVTFKDYALAVLKTQVISNPEDHNDFYDLLVDVFKKREILNDEDVKTLTASKVVRERVYFDVYHDIDQISNSKSDAYRFLDDNRNSLFIPFHQDVFIADLFVSNKLTRQGMRLPKQTILQYMWREEVILEGPQFGDFEGERTTMLSGGTLVFDENGNVLSWFRKPGVEYGPEELEDKNWKDEILAGEQRRSDFLSNLENRILNREIGAALSSNKGMVEETVPPLIVKKDNIGLKFQLAPHLDLKHDDGSILKSKKRWEVSS